MSKISVEWEEIRTNNSPDSLPNCRRMKVFGGWIFDTWIYNDEGRAISCSAVFIPDPEHKWEIK